MDNNSLALPDGTGSRASHEAAEASSPKASIPSAGQWVVVRSRSYSSYYRHEIGQTDAVKLKTAWVKVGAGRRLTRVHLDDIVPLPDEDSARLLCQRLESAKAESIRREQAARAFYKQAIGHIYASAIEAGTAETPESGSVHESAGPKGDAQTESSHDH